jgi:hypothetical protein
MNARRGIAIATIVFFLLSGISGSFGLLGADGESEETAKLVREADEAYQNGDFKLAIEKYQKAMQLISEKKELAQTKQELFQTMTSLALTYFTIQENAKARKQLEDLVLVNPKYELDPEYFPPKFIDIFRGVQRDFLGRLMVTSAPPGAAVTLGSSELGAAPLTVDKVLKGKYELRAELKGFAPVRKEIIVQAAVENREELLLEAVKPLVEKSQPPPAAKKKRKLSPLILVGGAVAAVAVAVVLLTGKKSEPAKVLKSLIFSNTDPVPIDLVLPSYVPLNASGVPARIQKVEYRVVVNHPNHMEDLNINIVGTDSQTLFNIWNRNQSSLATTIIAGSTEAFNAVAPNGTWRLVVQNLGRNPGGEIREFTLRIYYYQ